MLSCDAPTLEARYGGSEVSTLLAVYTKEDAIVRALTLKVGKPTPGIEVLVHLLERLRNRPELHAKQPLCLLVGARRMGRAALRCLGSPLSSFGKTLRALAAFTVNRVVRDGQVTT